MEVVDAGETSAAATTKPSVASWDTPAALVKRYFHQLTVGCGRKSCPNRNCRSCPDGHGALDPTAAAVLSLQLAQGQTHHLGDDGPPFLHLELVRDLVAAADIKRLVKELAGVFSNSVPRQGELEPHPPQHRACQGASTAAACLPGRTRSTRASC